MAWAFKSVTAKQSGTGNVAVNYPASMQPGDSVFLLCARGFGNGIVWTTPDFTPLVSRNSQNSLAWFYRAVDGTEGTTELVSGGVGNCTYMMARFSGGPSAANFAASIVTTATSGHNGAGLSYAAATIGANPGCLVLAASSKQASITSYNVPAVFTGELFHSVTSDGGQSFVADYIIQTVAADIAAGTYVITSDTSAVNQEIIAAILPAASNTFPAGANESPSRFAAAARPSIIHEFWQVALNLRALAPVVPPPSSRVTPDFLLRAVSNVQLGIEQGIPRPLVGKDRMLPPVDWLYGWDAPQLLTALQSYGQGFDASDMTNIANTAPYLEFNWSVPPGPQQWNRSYDAGVNLSLLGRDAMPTGSLKNLSWDPPAAARQPAANRSYEQAGLSLFYNVPPKPPLVAEWPVPPRARQPVQDFVQGMPDTLLNYLTTFPPFAPSAELPPRRASLPAVLLSYEWSRIALLKGQDILPFGIVYSERQVRLIYNADIYSISEVSQFLIPSAPPVPPGGLGVRHVGRVILDPSKLGEAANVPFDFISGLGVNEVLVSASTVATLYSGSDPTPQSIVTAPATVSGTIAFQQITPTIVGNVYDLKCTVRTSQGNTLVLDGYFAVIPGLP